MSTGLGISPELPDVRITYTQGMGRRTPSTDYISGLVGFSNLAEEEKVYKFISFADAKSQLEVSDVVDFEANPDLFHIKRFFDRNPSATLYYGALEPGASRQPVELNAVADLIVDASNGAVRQIGVMLEGYADAPQLNAQLSAVVPILNAYAKSAFEEHRPIVLVVEGYGTAPANYSQMLNLRTLASPFVSVVIANTRSVDHLGADLGDALGMISLAKVNESVGWIEKFNLQNTLEGLYPDGGVWNKGFKSKTELDFLHGQGFMLARKITGLEGYVFNSFPTCTAVSDDWAWGWAARTALKATRMVYPVLAKKLESPIEMQTDGTIHPAEIGNLEAICAAELHKMTRDKEISSFEILIDPDQQFYENDEKVQVRMRVVPYGIARGFDVTMSLTVKLN